MIKKITVAATVLMVGHIFAQTAPEPHQHRPVLKANALFLPIGMLNAGIEFPIKDHYTVQTDVFISPWKSFAGKYMQVYMLGVEGRYYFDEAFKRWYVGANISGMRFIMQKYSYWTDTLSQYDENSPVYKKSDLYQDGFSYMLGVTVGYQFQLNEKLSMDIFVGGGTIQSFYRGYHKTLGVRYDNDPDRDLNLSGEWLPYRGGIMIGYKL